MAKAVAFFSYRAANASSYNLMPPDGRQSIISRRKNIVLDCKSILVKKFALGLSGAQIAKELGGA